MVSRASRPLQHQPLVSIVMAPRNLHHGLISTAIASVAHQTYSNWELCLCAQGPFSSETCELLRELALGDSRIRLDLNDDTRSSTEASNRALELTSGELVAFLDWNNELEPAALYEFVALLDERPDIDVVYSDENELDAHGRCCRTLLKPSWSPEYLRGVMYVGQLLMIRRRLVNEVGGLDPIFDGVQIYELLLRVSERAVRVEHLPLVLCHSREVGGSIPLTRTNLGRLQARAVQLHLDRTEIPAIASPHEELPLTTVLRPRPRGAWPLVSIVISTSGTAEQIPRCLDSIYERTDYSQFEVIVVAAGSQDRAVQAAIDRHPVIVVPYDGSYNRSRAMNLGAVASSGQLIVLLDDRVEVVMPGWLQTLAWQTELTGVGAVGPLLVHPNGTVQHAGVVLARGGPIDDVLRGVPTNVNAGADWLACSREVSAVTGTCLMTRRSLFDDVGGLNELFAAHHQDVDFCLQIRKRGLSVLFTPQAVLVHHVTASQDDSYEWLDRAILLDRWQSVLEEGDPYFKPSASLEHAQAGIEEEPTVAIS